MDYKAIIARYTVSGVPDSSIPGLMEELNLNEKKFWEFMCGQTQGIVGGEGMVYPWDIERFYRISQK